MKKLFFAGLLFLYHLCPAQISLLFADSIRKTNNIPELSYAVINDTKILEIAALGFHSVDLKDSASLNDRFHIGSNTKAMTAFIAARYVDMKKIKWETKFFDLFPNWKKNANTAYYNITLADLLSHRAMIQPFQGENDPVIPAYKGSNKQKRIAFGKFVLTQEPVKNDSLHPFTYSNADYTLAAIMIEKVSRLSWEQLVDKIFNQELKLNVKTGWPNNQTAKDTWGHFTENGKLIPVPSNTDFHLDYTEPAGDINIKLKDYIRFIQLNIQGLEGKTNFLKAETYQFIHEGIPGYSLGWYNIYENDESLSTHFGTAGTYYTVVHIDRKRHLGYIIFANAFNEETRNGVRFLMRKLKENYSKQ